MAEVSTFYQSKYTGEQLDDILKNVYDSVPLDGSKPMTGPLKFKSAENGYGEIKKDHTGTSDFGTTVKDVAKNGDVVALLLKAADKAARLQLGSSLYDLIHTGNILPYVKPYADAAEAASEQAASALAGVREAINNIPEGTATPIVNDLTTGGASMALSAEMGKFLGENLPRKVSAYEFPYADNVQRYTASEFWKNQYGEVMIVLGLQAVDDVANGSVIGTMPVGFRPTATTVAVVQMVAGTSRSIAQCNIVPNGTMSYYGPNIPASTGRIYGTIIYIAA